VLNENVREQAKVHDRRARPDRVAEAERRL
jgi:hypothetical protein